LAAVAHQTALFAMALIPARLEPLPDDPDARPHYQIRDFGQEWMSARNLLTGQPIYRDLNEASYEYLGFRPNLNYPAIHSSPHVNAHPPTSVLLAVPFAWMNYPMACLAWNLVSLILFVATLWLVVRQLGLRVTGWGLLTGYALLVFCHPLRAQVNEGQLNLVLLALITGAWAAERSNRPGLAGVLLGLATAIKLLPGFLLVYYAARGRWQVVLAGVAAFAVSTALTMLVVGVPAYSTYVFEVLPHLSELYSDAWINASLSGLWHKLFAAQSSLVRPLVESRALYFTALAVGDGFLLLVLLAATRRARTREELDLTFGLAVVAMLLVSPLTWVHYYVLLLVPVVLLWTRLGHLGNWQWLFLVSLVALWFPPPRLVHWLTGLGDETLLRPATPWQVIGIISFQCYALLALFAVLTAALRMAGASNRQESASGVCTPPA
jgi:hypothetical protein